MGGRGWSGWLEELEMKTGSRDGWFGWSLCEDSTEIGMVWNALWRVMMVMRLGWYLRGHRARMEGLGLSYLLIDSRPVLRRGT